MEAVGEEEDKESGEEAALMAIREDEEAPSEADISLLISSLHLRDTIHDRPGSYSYFLPNSLEYHILKV